MSPELRAIAGRFAVAGTLAAVEPFGSGHINDSYLVCYRQAAGRRRFLLQRLNQAVFPDRARVMHNIQRVTTHIAGKLAAAGCPDADRRVLRLVPTRRGQPWLRDRQGGCWRLYPFLESARAYQTVATPQQAFQAGRAFGNFQRQLADLPGPRLHTTIPDFHNTPRRYHDLYRAIELDPCNRAAAARREISFARRHQPLAGLLLELARRGELPERAVHNDAKISNLLFDAASGTALCVVDLDTVMPGLALYDFGDMVRSMTCPAAEDETDLSTVGVRLPLFAALARGYLEAAGPLLNPAERAHLVPAGRLLTLEQGVRFLTDFLTGDTYYRTCRPDQNLDRCRNQFRLLAALTRHEPQLRRLVARL